MNGTERCSPRGQMQEWTGWRESADGLAIRSREDNMDLVRELIDGLKLSERQAKGGVGALLYVIRDQVSPGIFHEVLELFPEAEAWMKLSPEGGNGFFGTLDAVFRNIAGGNLEAAARLGGHFRSLGVDASMARPFAEQVLEYLQARLKGRARDNMAALLAQFRA